MKRPAPLALALLWLSLPVTAGWALPVEDVAVWVLAGLAYGAGALALFRPGAVALTSLRMLGPSPAALLVGNPGRWAGLLVALALLLTFLAWSGPVGQAAAEASAAPGERRWLLAAPPGLQYILGPLAGLAAAVAVAVPVATGRLLTVPLVVVAPASALAVHRLSRRWLVLVPSGVVIHDPLLLEDTLRLSPDEVGAVALTSHGWRERLDAPEVLDLTGGVRRALWIGLTSPVVPPSLRVRSRTGAVRHIFCAPHARAEAALALRQKGYRLAEPVGAP